MIQISSAICWAATTYKAVFHGEFDEMSAVCRSGDRIYKSENGRRESRSMWLRLYCFIRGISTQGNRISDPESPCASGQVTRFKAKLQSIRRATGHPLARGSGLRIEPIGARISRVRLVDQARVQERPQETHNRDRPRRD